MSVYKKLAITLILLVSCRYSYANTVSLGTISADATAAGINNNFTTLANAINGNVEGSTDGGTSVSNIKADSVFEINMADDANPRVRDSQLLGITVDTTTTQGTYVYSGLTPATSANLTSNISAGTAYINGYYVTKVATSNTYTASRDTYVDLSQAGAYTFSAVANGATAPSVAANSARLAKVVTDGTSITSVTDLANRRLPGLVVPANFRDAMDVSRDSTTTISVMPGSVEINNTIVSKTSPTTLTVTGVAGDWAGGTDLSAVLSYFYVGIDASGNLKLHTTRPTHQNYGVSLATGKNRYATWSSTVYRIIGWGFLDGSKNLAATVSQDTSSVSNISEHGMRNTLMRVGTADYTFTTSFALMPSMDISIDTTGGPVSAMFEAPILDGTGVGTVRMLIDNVEVSRTDFSDAGGDAEKPVTLFATDRKVSPGTHTVRVQARESTGGTAPQQLPGADGPRILKVWED